MIEKIKNHWEEHKEKYYIGAICTLTTALAASLYYNNKLNVMQVQTVDGDNNLLIQKSINVSMSRPGPKSFVIKSLDDDRVWPSLNSLCKDLGLNRTQVSEHLDGVRSDVKGLKFDKVTEI